MQQHSDILYCKCVLSLKILFDVQRRTFLSRTIFYRIIELFYGSSGYIIGSSDEFLGSLTNQYIDSFIKN